MRSLLSALVAVLGLSVLSSPVAVEAACPTSADTFTQWSQDYCLGYYGTTGGGGSKKVTIYNRSGYDACLYLCQTDGTWKWRSPAGQGSSTTTRIASGSSIDFYVNVDVHFAAFRESSINTNLWFISSGFSSSGPVVKTAASGYSGQIDIVASSSSTRRRLLGMSEAAAEAAEAKEESAEAEVNGAEAEAEAEVEGKSPAGRKLLWGLIYGTPY